VFTELKNRNPYKLRSMHNWQRHGMWCIPGVSTVKNTSQDLRLEIRNKFKFHLRLENSFHFTWNTSNFLL